MLLRKRLVEFETTGGDGTTGAHPRADRRDAAALPGRVHQRGTGGRPGRHRPIKKAVELGFLRQLRGQTDHWEVRRILKAFVDAQSLADFAAKLREYAGSGDRR